ncbi:uncharacterized protein LOC131693740 [Topomyia yanbarensis]|uniref:uncharacterized protein LOC131693740 n=1 Tax=Topomyia yanbarensis TaxID=2498891 RepID=UPI00273CA370|nr:uncharacterized protein LOC131693740 [Topomyia yanbarensis]
MVISYANDKTILGIKERFSKVFHKDFSSPIVGYEADLVLKEDSPVFRWAYDVPYRLQEKVIEHLEMLEREKVITPIKTSEWASPVVIVMKKNQISIGSVIVRAHRSQLRVPKASSRHQNLAAPCKRDCKRNRHHSEDEFFGFSNIEVESDKKKIRANDNSSYAAGSPALKRSERIRLRRENMKFKK